MKYLVTLLLPIVCFTFASPIGLADPYRARPESSESRAGHLTADAILSQYAIFNAAGLNTRELAFKIDQLVRDTAAAEHIDLPAPLTASDRRMIDRLKEMDGDDFDVAYIALAHAWNFLP